MAETQPITAAMLKAAQDRTDAFVRYYKAKLDLAEAHAKFVSQAIKAGHLELADGAAYR
jgi:hypothetical protein